MKRSELRKMCKKAVIRLKSISFDCWTSRLHDFPVVRYFRRRNGDVVDIEIDILDSEESYLHIIVRVSDGGWLNSWLPVCESFLVMRNNCSCLQGQT